MATGTDKSKQPRLHYGWVVLAMGAMVVFASLGLGRFAYSVVLPAMREGLGMDNRGAGALATANLIGYLSFSVIGGLLAARFGPRRVIAAGLTLAAVGMAMTGLARSIAAAAVWRALVGIGSGASNVPVMGLMAAWFAPRLAPAALGFITLFFGVGQAAGPTIAGAMADATGSFAPALWLSAAVAVLGSIGALLLPLRRGRADRQVA